MSALSIALLMLVAIPKDAAFPTLPTHELTMVDVHESALSQDEKRAVMSLVLGETTKHRCSNPVMVVQPVLAPHRRVIIINGCERSATGNALFWITLEGRPGLEVLATSNYVQQIYVLGSATNGFRDIVVATHESAFKSDLRLTPVRRPQVYIEEVRGARVWRKRWCFSDTYRYTREVLRLARIADNHGRHDKTLRERRIST